MKKILLLLTILLYFSTANFAQNKNVENKSKSKEKKSTSLNTKSKSFVNKIDFNQMSATGTGEIFVGGRVGSEGFTLKVSNETFQVNKISQINSVKDVFFINSQVGWVTDGKNIYKTFDAGKYWVKSNSAENENPEKMFFLDEFTGWYSSRDTSINKVRLRKTDDSNKIKSLFEISNCTVRKIQFVNQNIGWINYNGCGYGFEQTKDGGNTWNEVKIDKSISIRDMQFINENEGFVLDADSRIFFSNDKGENWNLMKTPTNHRFSNLFFINKDVGWVGGENICRTTNGGISWKCSDLEESYVQQIIFLDSANGWLITDNDLYFTKDGGIVWSKTDARNKLLELYRVKIIQSCYLDNENF